MSERRRQRWLDSRTIIYDTSAGGARTLSLERQVLDWAGRAVATDRFQSLNEAAYEKIDTVAGTNSKKIIDDTEATLQQANFYRTEHRYNAAGLLDCTKNAVGTITQVVYDGLGRPTQTWVGVEVEADDVVTVQLQLVSETAYDPISGLLASVTLKPGGGEADRVTQYWHDWRGRLVASKDGVQASESSTVNRPLTVYELDNLGQAVAVSVYDADGWAPAIGGDGTLAGLQPGQLRARTEHAHDAQGRVYRTRVFNIDQAIGANGPSSGQYLQTDIWYDKAGRVIKRREPGGLVTKMEYDDAGRVIDTRITDGGGDSGWNDAGNVSNDIILEHVHLDRDKNGNVLVSRLEQRKPDGTMRTSRTQYWYDKAGRLENSADLGTLGGTYASPLDAVVAGALLTGYTYDRSGNLEWISDPRGTLTRMGHDALGRMTSREENPVAAARNERHYVTVLYNGLDRPIQTMAQNWLPDGMMTPKQYTHNRYGTGHGLPSAVASNDLPGKIEYPDGTFELFGYNALGEVTTKRERNTGRHDYGYDVAGRAISDRALTRLWMSAGGC